MTAPERKLRLVVDLTYNHEAWHGDDDDAKKWFEGILSGDNLHLSDLGEAGDIIGSVKVIRAVHSSSAARIAELEAAIGTALLVMEPDANEHARDALRAALDKGEG